MHHLSRYCMVRGASEQYPINRGKCLNLPPSFAILALLSQALFKDQPSLSVFDKNNPSEACQSSLRDFFIFYLFLSLQNHSSEILLSAAQNQTFACQSLFFVNGLDIVYLFSFHRNTTLLHCSSGFRFGWYQA